MSECGSGRLAERNLGFHWMALFLQLLGNSHSTSELVHLVCLASMRRRKRAVFKWGLEMDGRKMEFSVSVRG